MLRNSKKIKKKLLLITFITHELIFFKYLLKSMFIVYHVLLLIKFDYLTITHYHTTT